MSKKQNKTKPTENTGAEAKDKAEFQSSRHQTLILVGIGLVILGIIFIIIALYQPTVTTESTVTVKMLDAAETVQGDAYESAAENAGVSDTEDTAAGEGNAAADTASGNAGSTSAANAGTASAGTAQQTSAAAQTTAAGTAATAAQTTAATTTTALSVSYPLNLNTCTQAELETLDGIGEARAYAIISYREYLGGYTSTEQVKEIKGISDGIYEKIKDYITV